MMGSKQHFVCSNGCFFCPWSQRGLGGRLGHVCLHLTRVRAILSGPRRRDDPAHPNTKASVRRERAESRGEKQGDVSLRREDCVGCSSIDAKRVLRAECSVAKCNAMQILQVVVRNQLLPVILRLVCHRSEQQGSHSLSLTSPHLTAPPYLQ